MSHAYYNENDPKAAAWLRELIAGGHIAPGEVDERSVKEVRPSDLKGFTQCHFFAGIGGWSYALRLADWEDDRPVWTGSCPCQPFSASGKKKGFDDERHLWPDWFRLIRECRPGVVFGEQVASKPGLAWLDLVQTDLENADYAVGAFDLCAAGIGAPHLRQRLWICGVDQRLADDKKHRVGSRHRQSGSGLPEKIEERGHGISERVADQPPSEIRSRSGKVQAGSESEKPDGYGDGSPDCRLADRASSSGPKQLGESGRREAPASHSAKPDRSIGLADSTSRDTRAKRQQPGGKHRQQQKDCSSFGMEDHFGKRLDKGREGNHAGDERRQSFTTSERCGPGPVNGSWRAADWLFCRDGKWRPVEPGTFPLAHGLPARLGRLRGYGNAIVPELAATFIRSAKEII